MASVSYNVAVSHFIVRVRQLIQSLQWLLSPMKFATWTKCRLEKMATRELLCAKDHHFWNWFQHVSIGCVKLACCQSTNAIGWLRNRRVYQIPLLPVLASIIRHRFFFSSYFLFGRTHNHDLWTRILLLSAEEKWTKSLNYGNAKWLGHFRSKLMYL